MNVPARTFRLRTSLDLNHIIHKKIEKNKGVFMNKLLHCPKPWDFSHEKALQGKMDIV